MESSTFNIDIVLQTLKAQPNFLEQYQLKSFAIFGSTARNEATANSDLDFLVEFNTDPTLKIYMNLKFFLEELFQKKVDLVIANDVKDELKETILKEAVYVS